MNNSNKRISNTKKNKLLSKKNKMISCLKLFKVIKNNDIYIVLYILYMSLLLFLYLFVYDFKRIEVTIDCE